MHRNFLLALLVLPLACKSDDGSTAPPVDPVQTEPEPRAGLPTAEEARVRIADLEDRRSDGGGALVAFLSHPETAVREAAVVALGRLPYPEHGEAVTAALVGALGDARPGVREHAAFALGLRGDEGAEQALLDATHDTDPKVRAAIVTAAGRIGTPALREEVLFATGDEAEVVRAAAVIAPHAWPLDAPDAGEVDSTLVNVARRRPLARGIPLEIPGITYPEGVARESAEVVWRALFTLQRRKSAAARELFLAYAPIAQLPEARLFAVKGLAALAREARAGADGAPADDPELRTALERATRDLDWRVAVEALPGLGALGSDASLETLDAGLAHSSAHVRMRAVEALGAFPPPADAALVRLGTVRGDQSINVRAAALVAEARLRGDGFAEGLRSRASDPTGAVRLAVARALDHLSDDVATPMLLELSRDPDRRVVEASLSSLADRPGDSVTARIEGLAEGVDAGVRAAAVEALISRESENLEVLQRAWEISSGDDVEAEARATIVRALGALGTGPALDQVVKALSDPSPRVRRAARTVLRREGRPFEEPAPAPGPPIPTPMGSAGDRPMVEIETTRGVLQVELFADEAPRHVHNFLTLAGDGHYDGLTSHRVVADFVVQGGCHRGDGYGAMTWRGGSLGHELSSRPYLRGTLGMPRGQDLDSGGSQFFFTHRPTPHLDGRYTVFGEIRSGFDVLDRIEENDRILAVRLR